MEHRTARDQSFPAPVDPRRYNGASLLGLRGIVVKSHGSADSFAFEVAVNRAWDEAAAGSSSASASASPPLDEAAQAPRNAV